MTNFKTYLISKGGITEEQFLILTQNIVIQSFKKGQYILHPGEICKHAFFIEQGLMRSFSIGENGKEHIIQFAPENWIISDRSSAFFNEPSEFFIEAIEDTTAVLWDTHFIQRASDLSASFRDYNDRALQNHIRHIQQRINLLLGASAEQRYLDFISLYPDLTLRVPQWMIASYLGITPESLSRVRKELAKRNFK
jgi:CRP-like cAMP-binding protein